MNTSVAQRKLFYFIVGGVLIGGYSAIALAVINSRTDVIHVLLQSGADVNQRGGAGFTALHWSAVNNNTDAVRILLQHDASITTEAIFGRTPNNLAREGNHVEAVLLLQH